MVTPRAQSRVHERYGQQLSFRFLNYFHLACLGAESMAPRRQALAEAGSPPVVPQEPNERNSRNTLSDISVSGSPMAGMCVTPSNFIVTRTSVGAGNDDTKCPRGQLQDLYTLVNHLHFPQCTRPRNSGTQNLHRV